MSDTIKYIGNKLDRTTIVGIPVRPDYQMDARITCTAEAWDRRDGIETHYEPSFDVIEGRDRIVESVKYRIPSPANILFMDSDILPRYQTLDRLYSHDKDIVTGVYPMIHKKEMVWSVSRNDPFEPLKKLPSNPFKVSSCGFGIIMVKFHVFEKLGWPYWKRLYKPGAVEMGEDIYFCQKAREAGFDIWCDPKVKCNHIKMVGLLDMASKLLKDK